MNETGAELEVSVRNGKSNPTKIRELLFANARYSEYVSKNRAVSMGNHAAKLVFRSHGFV